MNTTITDYLAKQDAELTATIDRLAACRAYVQVLRASLNPDGTLPATVDKAVAKLISTASPTAPEKTDEEAWDKAFLAALYPDGQPEPEPARKPRSIRAVKAHDRLGEPLVNVFAREAAEAAWRKRAYRLADKGCGVARKDWVSKRVSRQDMLTLADGIQRILGGTFNFENFWRAWSMCGGKDMRATEATARSAWQQLIEEGFLVLDDPSAASQYQPL